MADYTDVTVKNMNQELLIQGAIANRTEGGIQVISDNEPYPTLSVGTNYYIDGKPDLRVTGALESQDGEGTYNFKVD